MQGQAKYRVIAIVMFAALAGTIACSVLPKRQRKIVAPIPILTFLVSAIWLGIRGWLDARADDEPPELKHEPIGRLAIEGERLLVSDAPKSADTLPIAVARGEFSVERIVRSCGGLEELQAVSMSSLDRQLQNKSGAAESQEIIVDSGELWIVDATFELPAHENGFRTTECPANRVHVLKDQAGRSRGLVIFPSYGDGTYECRVDRNGAGVVITINFLHDD